MARSPHNPRLQALSVVVTAVPFGFALIRAVRTGHDLRYLWVAFAALCGAAGVMMIAWPYRGGPNSSLVVSTVVFVTATLCAVLAASLLGTRLGLGILIVGAAFGFCIAIGCLLHLLARS